MEMLCERMLKGVMTIELCMLYGFHKPSRALSKSVCDLASIAKASEGSIDHK